MRLNMQKNRIKSHPIVLQKQFFFALKDKNFTIKHFILIKNVNILEVNWRKDNELADIVFFFWEQYLQLFLFLNKYCFNSIAQLYENWSIILKNQGCTSKMELAFFFQSLILNYNNFLKIKCYFSDISNTFHFTLLLFYFIIDL